MTEQEKRKLKKDARDLFKPINVDLFGLLVKSFKYKESHVTTTQSTRETCRSDQ